MELEKFVIAFCEQFEDENTVISATEKFRELASWDSLTGMAVLYMIEKEYDVTISVEEFKNLQTPEEIFKYIQVQIKT